MLRVRDLELSFGGIRALDRVSFDLGTGQWEGLIGPNGSGKSSTLNVLTGFYRPQRGSVLYQDRELLTRRVGRHERAGMVRTFQHPSLSGRLSVLDNILLGSQRLRSVQVAQAVELADQLGCAPYLRQAAGEVPYGVRKRAEIVRALLRGPSVLLLDEPAAGLSDEERAEVIVALQALRGAFAATSAVVIEHDVRFVSHLCEVAVALDFGTVVASGPTGKVLDDPKVRGAFLGEKGEDP